MSTASQTRDQTRNGYRRAPISGRPRLFGEISKSEPFDFTEYANYCHMLARRPVPKRAKVDPETVEPRTKFLPHAARPLSVAKGANGRYYALLSNGSVVVVRHSASQTNFVQLHNGTPMRVLL